MMQDCILFKRSKINQYLNKMYDLQDYCTTHTGYVDRNPYIEKYIFENRKIENFWEYNSLMSGFHVHNNYSHCHALYPMLVSSYYKFFIIVLYSIVEAFLNSFAAF